MNLPGAYGKGLNLSKKGKVEKTDINPLTGLTLPSYRDAENILSL
jgi:hypothetical protein